MGSQNATFKTDGTGLYICEAVGDQLINLVRYHLERKKSILFVTENTLHLEELRKSLGRSGIRGSTILLQTTDRDAQVQMPPRDGRYPQSHDEAQTGRKPDETPPQNTFTAQQLSQMYAESLAELKKSGKTLKPLPLPPNAQENNFSFWQGLSYANLLSNVFVFRALISQVFGRQSIILVDPDRAVALASDCADTLQ